MDDKYIKLEAVLQYLFVYLVLILGLVRGDGQCRNLAAIFDNDPYTVGNAVIASGLATTKHNVSDFRLRNDDLTSITESEYCVSNTSCLHDRDQISISWDEPKNHEAVDYHIGLSNVSIGYSDKKYVMTLEEKLVVKSKSARPNIDFVKTYTVTINARYTNSWGAYQISKECTKVDNSVVKSTSIQTSSIKTTTVSREAISRPSGTSKNMSQKATTVQKNMTRTPERQGNQNLIIGLCSAGGIAIVVVTIVIIICIKRRKENKQGTQNESKRQKGNESNRFEEEDTYNHLSHDHHVLNNERGRQRNYLTNDDGEEEDTYNHMSLRYHDDKGTTEAALQDTYSHITLAKEDSANRMQISTQSAGNYDDISFKDEGEKEQGDKGRGEGGQSGSNPDKSNTAVPVDVHEVINADVPSTSENETGTALNRTEGPKGDLYTEVAIKN